MRHTKIIITLGVLLVSLPFLALPSSWQHIITITLGLGVVFVAYRMFATRSHYDAKSGAAQHTARTSPEEPSGANLKKDNKEGALEHNKETTLAGE